MFPLCDTLLTFLKQTVGIIESAAGGRCMRILCRRGGCTVRERARRPADRRRRPAAPGRN